jgi:NADH dehydrogenase FAD-containing subunit
LHAGVRATQIDRERKVVIGAPLRKEALAYSVDAASDADAGIVEEPYDRVIIATGSRPFVPPMEGFGGSGTFMFRTIDDCSRIADFAKDSKRAAVIGGGLPGLERVGFSLTVSRSLFSKLRLNDGCSARSETGDISQNDRSDGMRVCNTTPPHSTGTNGTSRVTHLEFKVERR